MSIFFESVLLFSNIFPRENLQMFTRRHDKQVHHNLDKEALGGDLNVYQQDNTYRQYIYQISYIH